MLHETAKQAKRMNKPDQSVRTIFNEAVEIADARQRAAHLAVRCGDNAALRQQVDNLIEAHEAAGKFLGDEDHDLSSRVINPAEKSDAFTKLKAKIARDNYLAFHSTPALPTAQPGDHIGRYKLLQQIGEGGCGVVFMAEQEEPIRRKVALKVIKFGMDTRSVIARFEAERQALALMDHPNIARVFDAGATDTGRPTS